MEAFLLKQKRCIKIHKKFKNIAYLLNVVKRYFRQTFLHAGFCLQVTELNQGFTLSDGEI